MANNKDNTEKFKDFFNDIKNEKDLYLEEKREKQLEQEKFDKLNRFYTQHCYYCVLSDVCKLRNSLTEECHHFYPDFDHIPRRKF